jgi:hydrogenase maturation factor HypF (carbamoyltransferase family)
MKITEKKISGVTVINIDPGDTVLCDLCNEDYTHSEEKGGFLFSGKAVCPKCAPRFILWIKLYNEEKYIRAEAQEGETFRDFVYRIRKQNL